MKDKAVNESDCYFGTVRCVKESVVKDSAAIRVAYVCYSHACQKESVVKDIAVKESDCYFGTVRRVKESVERVNVVIRLCLLQHACQRESVVKDNTVIKSMSTTRVQSRLSK